MSGLQFMRPQHLLDYYIWGRCWSLVTSYNQSQNQFPSLKDALQLICTTLLEKTINSAVKYFRK